jgi:hypothetical protein
MDAVGCVADQHIANGHGRRVDEIWFFGAADAESREFDDVHRHDAWHFGGFATGKDAVASLKVVGHPRNEAGDFLFVQGRDADVVEEKQWIAARRENVIHAHGDKVLASGFEKIVLQEKLQLGPDSVATGHHHRFFVRTQIVTRGKKPKSSPQFTRLLSPAHMSADVAHQGGRFPRIHPCLLIS